MGKFKQKQEESSDDDESIPELVQGDDDSDEELRPYEERDSDEDIAAQNQGDEDEEEDEDEDDDMDAKAKKQFGQRAINNVEGLVARLKELKNSFYNTLSSKKLIKKQGRIPFTEHLTITNENTISLPEGLSIHDDIKREMAFYNITRENVKKGMDFLVQGKVPISRPDDFFAEMIKTDQHMAKVKSRLLNQQQKVTNFEERKQKMENKKFHKAIKAYKQGEKHKEKRSNVEQISKIKKQIKDRGDDMEERDYQKLFNGGENKGGVQQQGGKQHQRRKTIDIVKQQSQQKRNKPISKGGKGNHQSKNNNKRPGKAQRSKHKRRNKK